MIDLEPLDRSVLPDGIRSRFVDGINGLRFHVLEAGFEGDGRPRIWLLHGFPELAFSWRHLMPLLADAGYHVIAPDHRGYGRTTGADTTYDGDLDQFRILNLVRDQMGLVAAMGFRSVDVVVGHDFGARVAATCALARPDVFRSLILMSAPYPAIPTWPAPSKNTTSKGITGLEDAKLDEALATLNPPRKHYHWYYSTRDANAEMTGCPEGIRTFLRAYFHMKSGDWAGNAPHPLPAWTAENLGVLPTYYVMELDKTMPESVRQNMPSADEIASCTWLSEAALDVYAEEYGRTGFQGGLQNYRIITNGKLKLELSTFAGRKIDVPMTFISGALDWGIHQKPGHLESMEASASIDYRGTTLIDGAGHWVQQERPKEVAGCMLEFLRGL